MGTSGAITLLGVDENHFNALVSKDKILCGARFLIYSWIGADKCRIF